MDVIQYYASTNDSSEGVEEEFYSRLSTIIQNSPRQNITIMMGDFSAKIGWDNRGCEIMGQRGLGEIGDNGERFANQVIGGIVFHQKRQLGYHLTCQQRTRYTMYA